MGLDTTPTAISSRDIREGYPDLYFFEQLGIKKEFAQSINAQDRLAVTVVSNHSTINLPLFNLEAQLNNRLVDITDCALRFSQKTGYYLIEENSWVSVEEFNSRVVINQESHETVNDEMVLTTSENTIMLIHEIVYSDEVIRSTESAKKEGLIEQYMYFDNNGRQVFVNVYGVKPNSNRNVSLSRLKKISVLDMEEINRQQINLEEKKIGYTYLGPLFEFLPDASRIFIPGPKDKKMRVLSGKVVVRKSQFNDRKYY